MSTVSRRVRSAWSSGVGVGFGFGVGEALGLGVGDALGVGLGGLEVGDGAALLQAARMAAMASVTSVVAGRGRIMGTDDTRC